ncbi:energy transducer TonB family protein [Primorskyibacter sp. 2E107]|uniref:energy transducer TonB family protein n=1 Tax=Primorskyibacter sp. 2E107 TaxID=3403458 RepID=UPI003AF618D1
MMHRAGPAKLVALSVALVLHGALALALVSHETTKIEGADGGTEVRLGNAFADMAAGTLSAERPERAETLSAETHQGMADVAPPETARVEASAESARAVDADPVPSEPTAEAVKDVPPQRLAAEQAVPIARADTSALLQTAAPAPNAAKALQRPSASERIEADAAQSAAVARSLRPKPRSAEFVATHKPAQVAKPKPKPAPQAKPTPGNADRSARAGEATGQRDAVAKQSGTAGRQNAAGNAAASNYPGLVMRKLSRAGKPRVNARGTAVVTFSIATNGGLSSVSLARSSGSAALDQAALRLVRGAGPFPRPPEGARRRFSIRIQGR